MPTVDESLGNQSQLNAALRAGIEQLSRQERVVFTLYRRVVLPVDGFVFWVKASTLTASGSYNDQKYDAAMYDQSPSVMVPAPQISVLGSLHYQIDTNQGEDGTYGHNRVTFTSEEIINDLDAVSNGLMYIATLRGGVQFAFSTQGKFYEAAKIWHYYGDAVYPSMKTQIVDDPSVFNNLQVVSNSLPIWLTIAQTPNPFWRPPRTLFPMFPSFAVPDNTPPPYGSIHIEPEGTAALQGSPTFSPLYDRTQLCSDRVRITTYGLRNAQIQDYIDAVNSYSVDYDVIGIMSMSPPVQDHKRTQNELSVLAQKKTVTYEVNYYQTRMNRVARQLILQAIMSFHVSELPVPPG